MAPVWGSDSVKGRPEEEEAWTGVLGGKRLPSCGVDDIGVAFGATSADSAEKMAWRSACDDMARSSSQAWWRGRVLASDVHFNQRRMH